MPLTPKQCAKPNSCGLTGRRGLPILRGMFAMLRSELKMILQRVSKINFNPLDFILTTVFLAFSTSQAKAQQISFKEQTTLVQKELKVIDVKYSFIRTSGLERFQRFMSAYVLPNADRDQYRAIELARYFGNLKNVSGGPVLSYKDAVDLSELLIHFSRPENMGVLKINQTPKNESLFRSFAFYTIGLQRAFDRLEREDLKHQFEISVLKNKITNSMSQFLVHFQSSMIDDKWEIVYLYMIQSYYSDFDAEIVQGLANRVTSVLNDKAIEKFELISANNLLLEISLVCFSKCSMPAFKLDSFFTYSLSSHVKHIAGLCFKHCRSGLGFNPWAFGFYREYLKFLKTSNDTDYDSVRSEIVWMGFQSYLRGASFSFQNMFREQPFVYFKQGMREIGVAGVFLIGFIFNFAPVYYLLFLTSFFLLTFFGRQPFKHQKVLFRSLSGFSKRTIPNVGMNVLAGFRLILNNALLLFTVFFRNLWAAFFNDEAAAVYRIAANLILVGATLLLSDLMSYIESSLL